MKNYLSWIWKKGPLFWIRFLWLSYALKKSMWPAFFEIVNQDNTIYLIVDTEEENADKQIKVVSIDANISKKTIRKAHQEKWLITKIQKIDLSETEDSYSSIN